MSARPTLFGRFEHFFVSTTKLFCKVAMLGTGAVDSVPGVPSNLSIATARYSTSFQIGSGACRLNEPSNVGMNLKMEYRQLVVRDFFAASPEPLRHMDRSVPTFVWVSGHASANLTCDNTCFIHSDLRIRIANRCNVRPNASVAVFPSGVNRHSPRNCTDLGLNPSKVRHIPLRVRGLMRNLFCSVISVSPQSLNSSRLQTSPDQLGYLARKSSPRRTHDRR